MRERIYLAARFSRRHELKPFAEALSAAGHQVTSRWLDSDEHHLELTGQRSSDGAAAAIRDLEDVRDATVCIAFTEPADGRQGRGGRHVELGAAITLGLRLIVVGEPEHIFHLLPQVELVATPQEALATLSQTHPRALAA